MNIPNLSEIPELKIADPGEYGVRVTKAMEGSSTNTGRGNITLICEITDDDGYETIFHKFWLPMDGDDSGKARTMLRMLKEFVKAVGLHEDGLEVSDFVGCEFQALVTIDEYEGQRRNEIKKVL